MSRINFKFRITKCTRNIFKNCSNKDVPELPITASEISKDSLGFKMDQLKLHYPILIIFYKN